jgi:V-type H+-transporting ATPase subunit D
LADINSELDELDREEFYRLKKVASKKQRDTAEADAEVQAKKDRLAAWEEENGSKEGPADILAAEEDEDIIF